jgi:sugar lactone lactonase YvrE
VVDTGGHPLGLRFHPDGSLLICDATRGLLQHRAGQPLEVLSTSAEGTPVGFADDLDVDPSGRHVYFTDASSRWRFGEHNLDVLEHAGHGRLLHYDMATRTTRVLVRGLVFANGVTLGPDAAFVLVTETGGCRVHRHHLKGPRAGQTEVWLDNLPGYPDNIRFNGKDRYWLAIPAPRNALGDALAPYPRARWLVMQLSAILPLPVAHAAMVLCFDGEGRLVSNLQSHAPGAYHYITQVLEHQGTLYVSSLDQPSLARLPLGAALPS